MEGINLKAILRSLENNEISADDAFAQLQRMQYEDLGFAKIDMNRERRCGLPEAIFCQGKTEAQILPIAQSLLKRSGKFLATRASKQVAKTLLAEIPNAVYCEQARTITARQVSQRQPPGEIVVACAGTADLPVAEEARVVGEFLGNKVATIYDVGVAGLHRLISQSDLLRRANVLIVVAGMEGALASVVAGLVARPVIAVPTSIGYGASFKGLAPLLTMMNSCAPGVAVVNIDNGFGAACVASLINHTGMNEGPD